MRYKRGSASRASISTAIARTAPSIAPTEAAEIPRESTPLPVFHGKNAESGQDNLCKRSQKWEDDDDDDEEREKRKNIMDIEERRRQLEADAWATEVEAKRVRCRGCTRWIKLDQRSLYYRGLWDKHRDLCRGIKRLKGEYIPKRTRRSRGTASVAKRRGAIAVRASASGMNTSDDTTGTETSARSEGVESPTQPATSTPHRVRERPLAIENKRPPRTRRSQAFPGAMVTHSHAAFTSPVATKDWRSRSSSTGYRTPAPVEQRNVLAAASSHALTRSPPMELAYPVLCAHRDPWSSWNAKDGWPTPGDTAGGRSATYFPDDGTHATENYDDEDHDAGVFAPDIPSKCPSISCHHRFRFSTQRELDTYFGGATIASMAKNVPSIERNGVFHAVGCLSPSGEGVRQD